MPIGSGIVYNTGDLILSTVSSSGTAFLETKIAAATSSIVYFDSNARINSASLNSITVGTASYVSGSTSIITNLTASNISASSITGSLFGTSSWAVNAVTASFVSNAFVQGGNSFGTTALLGTNDANSLAFETNGSTRMTINSGGQVGIGVSPVSYYKTYIADTHRGSLGSSSLYIETAQNQNQGLSTSANDSGITNAYIVNNFTSSTVLQNQASFNQMIIAGSGSFSGSYRAERNGILFSNSASLDSSGNIVNTYLTNQISSNIPTFSIPNWVAGTQTYVDLITGNSTGSITNLYNHQISSPFPSGGSGGITVNNSYGIYIAKQKTTNIVTNGWGIYQIDTGDLNIFAGKTRIGSTTVPVNTLDVTGNISASVITASLFFGTASFATNSLTASYLTPTNSYTITNLTASNISASATGSFGIVGIGTTSPSGRLHITSSGGFIPLKIETQDSADSQPQVYIEGNESLGSPALATNIQLVSNQDYRGRGITFTNRTTSTSWFSGIPYTGASYQIGYDSTTNGRAHYVQSSSLIILSNGNIGIGTSSPGYKLTIQNDAASTNALLGLQNFSTSATTNHGVSILPILSDNTGSTAITAGGLYWLKEQQWTNDTTSRDSYLRIDTTENGLASEKVRITSAGNVGIGTTNPVQKLSVVGNIYLPQSNFITWNNGDAEITAVSGYHLVFRTYTGASMTEKLRITSDGNVGIGTNTPGALLEISSSTAASLLNVKGAGGNGILFVSGSGNVGIGTATTNHLLHLSTVTADVSVGLYTTNANASARNWLISANEVAYGDFNIKQSNAIGGNPRSAGTSRFYIQNDGNVGIGTTSPAYLLDVSGSSRHGYRASDTHQFTGSVNISGSVTFSGPIIYDNAVLLDYGSVSTPVVSTNYAVLQNLTGSYNSAFFDYFASSGSNFRAGTVIAGWSGSSVNYTEYSTTDVGNTNQLSMSVDLSGSFVRLLTRVSTTINWNIKTAGRYL